MPALAYHGPLECKEAEQHRVNITGEQAQVEEGLGSVGRSVGGPDGRWDRRAGRSAGQRVGGSAGRRVGGSVGARLGYRRQGGLLTASAFTKNQEVK